MRELVVLSAGWADEAAFHNRVGQIAQQLYQTAPFGPDTLPVYGCYVPADFGFRLIKPTRSMYRTQPNADPLRELDWDAVRSAASNHLGHEPDLILCLVYETGLCQAAQQYDGTWPRVCYVCDVGVRPLKSHLHELGHCLGLEHLPVGPQGFATSVMGFGREHLDTVLSLTAEQQNTVRMHLHG